MTAMTVMPRVAAEWTVRDLDLIPDDGLRYELLDGILLVSPVPTRLHQRATAQLAIHLHDVCPPEMEVLPGPLDWRPDDWTSLQPDVLAFSDRDLDSTAADSMILAVEVISPPSGRKDAVYKRSKYEAEGIASYWIVDPSVPSVTALDLVDGRYVIVGEATGDESLTLEKPFPVRIVPADLVRQPPDHR